MASALSDAREVYLALVTGLQDYVRKNGFRSVVLGMSGGIDWRWWQPSPAMQGARTCTACACPASTHRRTHCPMPPSPRSARE